MVRATMHAVSMASIQTKNDEYMELGEDNPMMVTHIWRFSMT